MNIKINFLNGTDYWKQKITDNAAIASQIMSSQEFLNKVASHPGFYFTNQSSVVVSLKFENAGDVTINVGFYSRWWTRAIAYEQDGAVYFNTYKEKYGAGSVDNVSHETAHALGYSHAGNSPSGNENTVPYWVGNLVGELAGKL